jgi:hypothetical protein
MIDMGDDTEISNVFAYPFCAAKIDKIVGKIGIGSNYPKENQFISR